MLQQLVRIVYPLGPGESGETSNNHRALLIAVEEKSRDVLGLGSLSALSPNDPSLPRSAVSGPREHTCIQH